MAENEILATATFSSVIHNNEICDEIVKWGAANGYPVKKAKLSNALEAYVGFTPEYMIFLNSSALARIGSLSKALAHPAIYALSMFSANVSKSSTSL